MTKTERSKLTALADEWERQGRMVALTTGERWQQSGLIACARELRAALAEPKRCDCPPTMHEDDCPVGQHSRAAWKAMSRPVEPEAGGVR